MTYNVFSGTLNPTHSLTHLPCMRDKESPIAVSPEMRDAQSYESAEKKVLIISGYNFVQSPAQILLTLFKGLKTAIGHILWFSIDLRCRVSNTSA